MLMIAGTEKSAEEQAQTVGRDDGRPPVEDMLSGKISVGQTKMVIAAAQVKLNHAALEEDYGQLDQAKRLPWRIPLLDRKTA